MKVPINRPYTDAHEEKPQNDNGNETPNEETNATEEPAHPATTESMAESVQIEVEDNQNTAANCDTDSMNNIKKTESPVKSTEASPKRTKSETASAEGSPEAITKQAHETPIAEESNPGNDNEESESNNNTIEIQMNNENNAQEAKKPENTNSEQMDEENNNVANEMIEENHSENTIEQASEENDTGGNEENENEDHKSEPNNADMDSEDNAKQEKSPEKTTSGSTPPPKPPRLKSGSSTDSTERTSSMEKEAEPNDVNGITEKNLNKGVEMSGESVQKRDARSTKSSTKSGSTRSPRPRVNTEETIEIDKQNDKDKIMEEVKLNDNTQDDADVVQSPAPRTGKASIVCNQ